MKANDFRLGNILIEQKHNEFVYVTDLSENRIGVTGDFKGRWQVKPIELNKEWFYKCGFELNKEFNLLSIQTETGEILFSADDFMLCSTDSLCKIKYVHQLQNLYFFLEGKEIKINL